MNDGARAHAVRSPDVRGARTRSAPPPFVAGGARALRLLGAAAVAAAGALALVARGPAGDASAVGAPLDASEVEALVARCLDFARRVRSRPDLTVAVVDPEGNSLGVFHAAGVPADPAARSERAAVALAKAGTGSYFSSDDQTFSTRTACFIIQDHFPPGVRFAPAGPLHGVEFSSIATSDVNPIVFPTPASAEVRVRGDLGGIGLFRGGRRVGGLGVDDGDRKKRVTIPPAVLQPAGCRDAYRLSFANLEAGRDLERIVVAAAGRHLAPAALRATEITVDGFRLPYARPTRFGPARAASLSPSDGAFDTVHPLRGASGIPSRFGTTSVPPPPSAGAGAKTYVGEMPLAFPVRAGTDGILSEADVRRILWQGARQADVTRAAIRRPVGLPMQCWIAVTDTRGEVLGVLRFRDDATLFSYDVAVQKARTAAFFSDADAAFSCRGLGLYAQRFYPAGQQDEGRGPLFQVQDGITVALLTGAAGGPGFPLRNGITVFPGGVPLYKDGVLAGGIGVSGDGIDQDDIVADLGSRGFGAPGAIRCDRLTGAQVKQALRRALSRLAGAVPPDSGGTPATPAELGLCFLHERLRVARATLESTELNVGPSYVKHPRHPGPVTIR